VYTVPLCLGVRGPGIAESRSVVSRVASLNPTILSYLIFVSGCVTCEGARHRGIERRESCSIVKPNNLIFILSLS
jgi:hypothetical protein